MLSQEKELYEMATSFNLSDSHQENVTPHQQQFMNLLRSMNAMKWLVMLLKPTIVKPT